MFSKETYINRRAELKKLVKSGVIILFGNNESPNNYPANAYYFSGENLASCDGILTDESFASSCVKWWMESESHRANILNPNYTVMAVGVAITANGMYAVQEFATPY